MKSCRALTERAFGMGSPPWPSKLAPRPAADFGLPGGGDAADAKPGTQTYEAYFKILAKLNNETTPSPSTSPGVCLRGHGVRPATYLGRCGRKLLVVPGDIAGITGHDGKFVNQALTRKAEEVQCQEHMQELPVLLVQTCRRKDMRDYQERAITKKNAPYAEWALPNQGISNAPYPSGKEKPLQQWHCHKAASKEQSAMGTSPNLTALKAADAWLQNWSIPTEPPVIPSDATAVVVRGMPKHYTQEAFLKQVCINGLWDYFHLPYNLLHKRLQGCAFINFLTHEQAVAFQEQWHGRILPGGSSGRPLHITTSDMQGWRSCLARVKARKVHQLAKVGFLPRVWADGHWLSAFEIEEEIRSQSQSFSVAPGHQSEASDEEDAKTRALGPVTLL
mmetsp:Transcript_120781/g.352795  ORF Transcript_120781/g.352795 Transcript_120781/m.352795 type:complete len:391 (+) Transcript_120781:124-1296(+)